MSLFEELSIAEKALQRWKKRCENELSRAPKLESLREEAQRLEMYAIGIYASKEKIKPFQKEITIPLYMESGIQEQTIRIPQGVLPTQLALQFQKKSAKINRSIEMIPVRLKNVTQDLIQIEVWYAKLLNWICISSQADDEVVEKKIINKIQSELEGMKSFLLTRGLWPQPASRNDTSQNKKKPIRWNFPDGWILWAGKDGLENDLITGKIARSHDLWFHAAHVPGAHVILRSPTGKPMDVPKGHIETAAGVAAWLSRLRPQSVAEVHFTLKKHVRKPRKSPPGRVVMEHASVLRVKPCPPPRAH